MRSILLVIACLWLFPGAAVAQESALTYMKAEVQRVQLLEDGGQYPVQSVEARILAGPARGQVVTFTNTVINQRDDLRLAAGERIILQRLSRPDGSAEYFLQEKYRLPALGILALLFFFLGVLIGRRRGFMSIVGLIVSIVIILFLIFPLILSGWNPLSVSMAGGFLIAGSTILISHGCHRRTFLALAATCGTLVLAVLASILAVSFARIFGLGSEESVFLQSTLAGQVDFRGLFLSGMIIGTLGVLDDITTTQVAAVDEVRKANPAYAFADLYRAGMSVGREHIASMINTLALAYIGASLPLFLLFSMNADVPVWVTLNSAFIAEEIVRTLVGSSALLLAAPMATWLAAVWLRR